MNDHSISYDGKNSKNGDIVTDFFVIRNLELKTKKDGGPYLVLDLGHRSGRLSGVLWSDAKTAYQTYTSGNIVKVKGRVSEYRNQPQLSIERIRKATPYDRIDSCAFIPVSSADIGVLQKKLESTIESIETPPLRALLQRIFSDAQTAERFRSCPGGKLWHHAASGGLLEHTMSVVEICETMTRLYPSIDRDLLITGALLHDIGKIEEYGTEKGFIDFTDLGRLWGHISLWAQQVRAHIEALEEASDFPDSLKNHLVHLILSHQGELEHGSPVLPATLEAMVLYYADEMDAKANAILQIIERDREPDRQWSRFIPMLNRFIFLGGQNREGLSALTDDTGKEDGSES